MALQRWLRGGAVVYLNGQEIWRDNLPTNSSITYSILALRELDPPEENAWLTKSLSPSLLVTGTNLLAAEIHQHSSTSSDLSFDFYLVAQIGAGTLQPPALSMATLNDTRILSWPVANGYFQLYTATNLAPPMVWTLATNKIVFTNTQLVVPLEPALGENRFYRLQSP